MNQIFLIIFCIIIRKNNNEVKSLKAIDKQGNLVKYFTRNNPSQSISRTENMQLLKLKSNIKILENELNSEFKNMHCNSEYNDLLITTSKTNYLIYIESEKA